MSIAFIQRGKRWAALACVLAVVGGCANLGPVKTFADETKQVGAAFSTIPATTVASCRAREALNDQVMPATARFSLDEVRRKSQEQCQYTASQSPHILAFATLLEQYADTLAALADEKLPDYKTELGGLKAAIDGLKSSDGQSIVPAEKTGAIIALGNFLARLATERAARSEIKNLLDQEEGFNAAADALSWYATSIYRSLVAQHRQIAEITLQNRLPRFEATEPLAARSMMISLAAERDRLKTLEEATSRFTASVDKMKAARAEVRAKLDKPDDKELWKQLHAFSQEVRGLRQQIRAAF